MNSFTESYNKLIRKLTSIRWLNKWNIDKNLIDSFLKNEHFITNFKVMLEKNDYTCKSTLVLCKEIMDKMAYPNAPVDWLNYIYQYSLSLSFSESVSIFLTDSLNSPSEFYLRVLKIINELQKDSKDGTWQSKYAMRFLNEEEENELEYSDEYKKFIKAFKHNYTYEMMKLSGEVMNFSTLDHVCGVHYLSLFIARQLKNTGINVDLGRVSGAAAGHDIGKYGCKGIELKRVPHLHYYYTDLWFKRYNIPYIGNVAINHSTWDLEFENLSIESILLIYSDFRVKNYTEFNNLKMKIFTLGESFEVILNKLENVDEEKLKRYKRVYSKLKDFEEFLISKDIATNLDSSINNLNIPKEYSLAQGEDIIKSIKYLSINHNINLMYKLRDEYSLDEIIEEARSEKDWKNLREYIRVFEEYSTYLTQKQKIQTIKFLYENLVHPEDDIRRHCAELIGTLIAIFDEDYRKEIPQNVKLDPQFITSTNLLEEYIRLILNPSYKLVNTHKFYIGYSLSFLIHSLFRNCRKNLLTIYRDIVLSFYDEDVSKNTETQIFLLQTAQYIPLELLDGNSDKLFSFILLMLKKRNSMIRTAALEASLFFLDKLPKNYFFISELICYINSINLKSKNSAENYLLCKICKNLDLKNNLSIDTILQKNKYNEIFLSNLKTDTDWIRKKIQLDLILDYVLKNPEGKTLQSTIHFCNLLKVSAVESVRNKAGYAILMLLPNLSLAERNEVAIELIRALEIEGNRFTEYIPYYAGQVLLWLQPTELDELISDLILKIKIANPNLKSLILKTLGITISNYYVYNDRFFESDKIYNARLVKMLGVLLNGLGDFNNKVKQSALIVLGKDIFGSKNLTLTQKEYIFKLIGKKFLNLICEENFDDLLFLTTCAGLNHMYRFISDFSFFIGPIEIEIPKKVAFFPGTFDPFSSSHKEIASVIRDLGFEVYFAIDEFSWSKKTLPGLLRKNILNMSISNELNMYIFPITLPINIANTSDLKTLKESFPNSEVYISIGSDVILNASSYKLKPTDHTIHSFSHIVFERGKNKKLLDAVKNITGEVRIISLSSKYSDISSTQIRNYIDENKDISSLIDPMAQQYIYENGFYQMEPQDKSTLKSLWLKVDITENFTDDLLYEISNLCNCDKKSFIKALTEISMKPSARLLILRDITNSDEIIGFSIFHWLRSGTIYEEIQDLDVSRYIREQSLGRIALIDGLFIKDLDKNRNLEQILLTETITFCISKDFEYAIFKPYIQGSLSNSIIDLLKLHGFTEMPVENKSSLIYIVNMSSPCILNLDIESIIKEPFRSNLKVKHTILITRRKLQEALTKLYPGELVLSVDINVLNQKLIEKICKENKMATEICEPRKFGNAMCVPYGDILDRYVIPNTVTKALHSEKLFYPNINDFAITEFPHYLPLDIQVKMLKSFNRPVLLVDNILHKGYRMKALDPLFKTEGIKVQKIIAGILSGRGKDLMDMQNREVDSVYFIPRLKLWFNENSLYPFIGGDALWRGNYPKRNLLPSINLIMPYTYPVFIKDCKYNTVYNLSKICLENAMDLLSCLEEEYHFIHERNLTLSSMGQVFTIPRCPDHGKNMNYDLTLSPSSYLKNDLELLIRYESLMNLF